MANANNRIALSLLIDKTRDNIKADLERVFKRLPQQKIALRLDTATTKKLMLEDLQNITKGLRVGDQKTFQAWLENEKSVVRQTKEDFASLKKQAQDIYSFKFNQSSGSAAQKNLIRVEETAEAYDRYEEAINKVASAQFNLQKIGAIDKDGNIVTRTKEQRTALEEYIGLFKELETALKAVRIASKNYFAANPGVKADGGFGNLLKNAANLRIVIDGLRGVAPELGTRFDDLYRSIESGTGDVGELTRQLRDLTSVANDTKSGIDNLEESVGNIFGAEGERVLGLTGLSGININSGTGQEYFNQWKLLRQRVNELKAKYPNGIDLISDTERRELMEFVSEFHRLVDLQALARADNKNSLFFETENARWTKLLDSVTQYNEQVKGTASRDPVAYAKLTSLITDIENHNGTVPKLANDFRNLKAEFRKAGLEAETLGQKFKRLLSDNIGSLIRTSVTALFMRSFREIYNNVREIDKELTQFQIVTRKSDAALKEFGDDAAKVAKDIAVSTKEVINAATVYARLGYTDTESLDLSKYTAMYSKVAGVEIGAAEENITATIKAFDISVSEIQNVLDKMTKVGKQYCPSMW